MANALSRCTEFSSWSRDVCGYTVRCLPVRDTIFDRHDRHNSRAPARPSRRAPSRHLGIIRKFATLRLIHQVLLTTLHYSCAKDHACCNHNAKIATINPNNDTGEAPTAEAAPVCSAAAAALSLACELAAGVAPPAVGPVVAAGALAVPVVDMEFEASSPSV